MSESKSLPPQYQAGIVAAAHLRLTIGDNPNPLFTPEGDQWSRGFTHGRTRMKLNTRRIMAVGQGLIITWARNPDRQFKNLIEMGKHSGEMMMIAVLALLLEAEQAELDWSSETEWLAIQRAMTQGMANRKYESNYGGQHEWLQGRIHSHCGALRSICRLDPSNNQIGVDPKRLRDLCEHAVFLAIQVMNQQNLQSEGE